MADLKSILGAVRGALDDVETVVKTPGINALPYVSTVGHAIDAIQAALDAGANVAPYVEAIRETFTGEGVPSEAQVADLDAKIAALEAQLDAPLPEREAGEPD